MKTYRVLVVLALVLIAGSAVASTGPNGSWPCVFGNNQLTSTHTHATHTGGITAYIRWEVWYPTEGGPWSSVVLDENDNIYTVINDSNGCFEKWDNDGNLIWTRPALTGWGTDCTGVIGNDDGAGGYWYVPSSSDVTDGDVLIKIDPADGTILWTHILGGGGYYVESAGAAMDDAGHIYVRSCGSGYLHRITDLGSSATEDWTVNVNTGFYNPQYGNYMSSVDPDQTKVYQVSGPPDYKVIALNATTGAVVWSSPCGAYNVNIWQDNLTGNPIVDDNGDVYAYAQSLADTSLDSGGVTKYDGDTGVILWTYVTSNSGAFGNTPCTGALNQGQTRLYHECGNQTIAIDTSTGISYWTLAVDALWQTNGSVIVDASNNPMVCGGGNSAMGHIIDNGTYGTLDWQVDPLDKELMDAYLDYCAINSDSELVEGRDSPGWNGGLYLAVHYENDPPIKIVEPPSIGPLEREIPIFGTSPKLDGLGIVFGCIGAQGPITYSVSGGTLPPGLTLTSDGHLRGAVAAGAANQYTVTIRANDGVLTDDKVYVIDIVDAPLQIGPGLPLGSVGNAYNGGLWIIGGTPPYTVAITSGKGDYVDATSVGNTGLSLTLSGSSAGQITGVPSAISSATLEVTVTDSVAASVTKDITVDVVDSRVWDVFQRTKRRVGTSTLPAPESYPHNLDGDRLYQYNSADTWQWAYDMYQAPTFAYRQADADGDGEDDGYMFISTKFAGYPIDSSWTQGWGDKIWTCAPYDVDPGGRYPGPHNFGGWYYNMNKDGWPGVHAPMWHPGLLKISNGKYATRLYYTNDNSGTQGRFACLNAQTGALLWSISGDSDGSPWIDRRGFMALLENGDIVDKIGQHEFWGCDPTDTIGVWTEAYTGEWWMRTWSDTYGIIRDLTTEGKIIWTAGEENTDTRDYVGPIFYNLGVPYWMFNTGYRGALTVFKLADEGELVIAQRGGNNPYYLGNRFVARADSVQNVTVWTVGQSGGDIWFGWTYRGTAPRACPVVDSTNNVYFTMDRGNPYGPASLQNAHIWCVEADVAADHPTILDPGGGNGDWSQIYSDPDALKWETHMSDANHHRLPAGPCLSRDQRTLYTVLVARADGFGGDFWTPIHANPGTKSKLVALHTINGAVKWIKDLEISGRSGCDWCNDGDVDWNTYTPMADSDNKVLCSTSGDKRQWWLTPGDPQNPQDPAFNDLLRPMAWCFRDTGTDATLLWTRATSREAYLDRAGPGSYAVTPNYRLVFAAALDPEWIGHDPGWTGGNRWWQDGVRLIHPDDIHVTKVDYNPGVNVTFTVQGGASYDVQYADGNAYSDTPGALTWAALPGGPFTAGVGATSMTVTDTTLPTTSFRFYRIKLSGSPFYSNEVCGAFKLVLPIGFAVNQFFISVPLVPDATATVNSVIGKQLDYANIYMDKLTESTALYTRATYDNVGKVWNNDYPIVAGAGYWLNAAGALPFPHTVVLTGYVSGRAVKLSVTRTSFATSSRWMGYSMPQPQTLAGLGLPSVITPFWAPTNQVRLLPLGQTAWKTYFFDGTNWRLGSLGGAVVNPAIACGEGILFIHNGIPGSPDVLPLPTWYYKPPVAW
jgi:hypothetical protein